ncbi:MAG: hypothetical protein E7452_09915 [Ruminococcaceae bacterium]|nr:hypothetical protein [Oscillospiraceae bacterium]
MLMTVISPLSGLMVFASDEAQKTDGELVAANYPLTAKEQALLSSKLLVGDTHTYEVPTAAENLISVDTDTQTISVSSYEGTSGYLWEPVSAKIMVGGVEQEVVALTAGVGTYAYDGNAFSVVVSFELNKEIDAATQELLLNAPAYLAQGLENLKLAYAQSGNMDSITLAMPYLMPLCGVGYPVMTPWSPEPITLYYGPTSDPKAVNAINATKELNNQMTANGGILDLSVMLNAYNSAASKVQYLMENGAALKAKLAETKAYIQDINNNDLFRLILNIVSESMVSGETLSAVRALKTFRNVMEDIIENIEVLENDPWIALTAGCLRAGLTDAEYLTLDGLMSGMTLTDPLPAVEASLLVDTTEIQHNLSMCNVTVNVSLKLTDPNSTAVQYVDHDIVKSVTLTLAENATEAEILAAVDASGIVADAKAAWGSVYDDAHFAETASELPGTLTEDTTYNIVYKPKLYSVTSNYAAATELPYGYRLLLEVNGAELKAYDYQVNGNYYAQGAYYTITGDTTITRTEGKSYVKGQLYQIVADNYLNGTTGEAILTSGALFGDEVVAVRYPDNNGGIVTLSGSTLTALPYAASYEGLSWKPYSYTLDTNGTTGYFNGAPSVMIGESFGTVTVTYRLYLTNFDASDIEDLATLPGALAAEAVQQLSAMASIAGQEDKLELLNNAMLGVLAGLVEEAVLNADAAKDAALKACFTEVLNKIKDECIDTFADKKPLKLYTIVAAYNNAGDKLLYYYQNHDAVRAEIAKFADYMTMLLGADGTLTADEKIDALKVLMSSAPNMTPEDIERYSEKLTSLETTMQSVKSNLTPPNAAIDTESAKLGVLTSTLVAGGEVDPSNLSVGLYLADSSIVMVADDKVALKVTLLIEGGETVTIVSDTVDGSVVIDAAMITTLKNKVAAALDAQSIVGVLYENNYDATVLDALVGQAAEDLAQTAFEFEWTYKQIAINVPGMTDQTVSLADTVIELAASSDPAERYDYYIGGVKVGGNRYSLSLVELTEAANGTFVVTREVINIAEEEAAQRKQTLIDYVDGLNTAIGNDQLAFVLVENGSSYSIVLKVKSLDPSSLMSAAMGMATGMVQGAYSYVGIDNNAFWDGKVHLQTLVDAVMNSGFGLNTLVNVIDASGNIQNQLTLAGTVLSAEVVNPYGGKLIETTMQLGSTESDALNVAFYITLGSANEMLVTLRNAYVDMLASYVDLVCDNGKANIALNLPQKAYEALLASLLVTGEIDLSELNDVDGEIIFGFINDMIMPLIDAGATLETIENTLAQFGMNLALSGRRGMDTIYRELVQFYTDAQFVYDENSGTATGVIMINGLLNSMDLGALSSLIAEKDTGLTVTVDIELSDLGSQYEALFVDINAAGIANKIGLTADLAAKLPSLAGASAVVLLSDVNENLTFGKTTLLNLNGFTVTGDITSNGKLIIVDANTQAGKIGTVDGQVSGNAIVVSGKYTDDVSDLIKVGYEQGADGVVANRFYDIEADGENITIVLNADMIHTNYVPNLTALVVDIACDLLFNGYAYNYLELAGNSVYDITLDDLVGLYKSTNRLNTAVSEVLGFVDSADLSALINLVMDDVADFAAISQAIENDEAIFEYEMVRKPWNLDFSIESAGNYITAGIGSGDAVSGNFSVVVSGSAADKAYLVDLFAELGEIVDADINLNMTHGLNGSTIELTVDADANVFVDLTNPDYAIMLSILVADGIGAPANADLIAGIETYYSTGSTDVLNRAFNALTTSQVVTALKNLTTADSFANMVSALGLDGIVEDSVEELEALYDRFGKLAAALVRRTDITGGSRTIGSYLDANGVYSIERSDLEKMLERALFKGYKVSVEVTVTDAYAGVQLFGAVAGDVDYTELENQIARAEKLLEDEDEYTSSSWAKMEAALEDAYEARNSLDQNEVDRMADALKKAINGLVKKHVPPTPPSPPVVDYSELEKQIAKAESLEESSYTAESWAVLATALEEAYNALNSNSQSIVNAAAKNLKDAIEALVKQSQPPILPDVAPEFVEGTGTPVILESDKVAGYQVDETEMYIEIDTQASGLTVAELCALLKFSVKNADSVTLTVGNGTLAETSLVCNGTKVTAVAANASSSKVAVVEYTIIIMGDVNSNGRIEVGDAVLISQALVGLTTLDELQIMAADINNNGRTDIGDATRNSSKIVDWDNYESMLENAAE